MKNENKVKKLVLRKETLRDLTAQNTGEVKGGATVRFCSVSCHTCWTCHCKGKTYNKKCLG